MSLSTYLKAAVSLFALVLVFACEKEYKAGGPIVTPNIVNNDDNSNENGVFIEESNKLSTVFNNEIAGDIQTFTITAENTQVIYTDRGIRLGIYGSPFVDKNGNEVTGEITLELLEVYEKEDMLRYNKSTNAINHNQEAGLLISGGQLYVQGYQNGEEIAIKDNASLSLEMPISSSIENPYQMSLWDGNVDQNGNITWETSAGFGQVYPADSIDGTSLYGNLPNFGWINCDYWYSDPREKTDVKVDFSMLQSTEFSRISLKAYFAIADSKSLLGDFRAKEETKFLFGSDYIPIGQELHVIVIGISDDDTMFYYIESIVVEENHEVKVTSMQPSNIDDIAELVKNLN